MGEKNNTRPCTSKGLSRRSAVNKMVKLPEGVDRVLKAESKARGITQARVVSLALLEHFDNLPDDLAKEIRESLGIPDGAQLVSAYDMVL